MAASQQVFDAITTDHLHADLRGRSVRGGVWTLSSQGAQFILQTISTVVLARLLTPADFGLVAMVTAVTSLGQAFADLGLSEATIQHTEISHEQISALFWINVAVGLGLMLVTAGMAPVLVWFYRDPRLREITLLMSLTFLIGGLRVQHTALLKRQMRFMALGIRDVVSYALAVPLAIALALRGAGYWAIVALPLTLNFTQMALSWLMVRWLPGLPRRGVRVRSLIVFGGNVAASYLVTNITRSADSIMIGWYWGAGPLGLYSRAYNLLMLPVRQLSGPAGSVAVPAFSRIQNDSERFARYYLRAVNFVIWISAPMFGFLFVSAKSVIVLVLGTKWGDAAPVFQILVLSALGQLLLDSTIWLFISRGQSARLLKLLLFVFPIMIGGFALGLRFGIKDVALAGSLVLLAIFPWVLKFSFRGTDLTLQRLGHAILKPIAVVVCSVVLAEVSLHLIAPQRIMAQLLTSAVCFVAAYSLSLLINPVRSEILSLVSLLRKTETVVLPELAENLETAVL